MAITEELESSSEEDESIKHEGEVEVGGIQSTADFSPLGPKIFTEWYVLHWERIA